MMFRETLARAENASTLSTTTSLEVLRREILLAIGQVIDAQRDVAERGVPTAESPRVEIYVSLHPQIWSAIDAVRDTFSERLARSAIRHALYAEVAINIVVCVEPSSNSSGGAFSVRIGRPGTGRAQGPAPETVGSVDAPRHGRLTATRGSLDVVTAEPAVEASPVPDMPGSTARTKDRRDPTRAGGDTILVTTVSDVVTECVTSTIMTEYRLVLEHVGADGEGHRVALVGTEPISIGRRLGSGSRAGDGADVPIEADQTVSARQVVVHRSTDDPMAIEMVNVGRNAVRVGTEVVPPLAQAGAERASRRIMPGTTITLGVQTPVTIRLAQSSNRPGINR